MAPDPTKLRLVIAACFCAGRVDFLISNVSFPGTVFPPTPVSGFSFDVSSLCTGKLYLAPGPMPALKAQG
jgi:hypothetical protein